MNILSVSHDFICHVVQLVSKADDQLLLYSETEVI